MVYLDQINEHYKNIGLKVLAINVNNPKIVNKVKPYVKKRNFKFDVAIDPEAKIGSALKVEGLPTTFFVDTDVILVGSILPFSDIYFLSNLIFL